MSAKFYIMHINQHNNSLARRKNSQNFFTGRPAFIQLKQQISMINHLTYSLLQNVFCVIFNYLTLFLSIDIFSVDV